MHTKSYLFVLFTVFLGKVAVYSQSDLVQNENTWTFQVNGNLHDVKGVTFGYDDDSENYDQYFEELQYLGVNTIRTWATGENTSQLLDAAAAHNMKVLVGIWMRHGRPGMEADDRFDYLNDQQGMKVMLQSAQEAVSAYKDHPAVLAWGVGNEVYLNTATDEEKVAYSLFLEKVCSAIKSVDSIHPVGSVEAWTFGIKWWEKYVPSLDFYGINVYGVGAKSLPEALKKEGATKPYVITEFGVRGEWDQPKDEFGITIEPSDSAKYATIVTGYREWIKPEPTCLGLFVFHYANENNFVSPWLLTHHRDKKRPQYWAIREAYTGEKPENKVPVISTFQLSNASGKSGDWIPVTLVFEDPENEPVEVDFYYNQRLGSRKRRDQINRMQMRGSASEGFEIQVPDEKEGIKVYVNVTDAFGNVGIATSSLFIQSETPIDKRTLVPKVELPFYVYKDGNKLPYIPSGYMGDHQYMNVDMQHAADVYEGTHAIKIQFNSNTGWYGLGLVDPPGDWGDVVGGYDISGANTFSFYAKSSIDGQKAKIGFGLIEGDKSFPDSAKELKEIELEKEWKKYTIKLKKKDLRYIRSGLVIFSQANIVSHSIYLDEVVFE